MLGDEGLAVYRRRLEPEWEKLPPLPPEDVNEASEFGICARASNRLGDKNGAACNPVSFGTF